MRLIALLCCSLLLATPLLSATHPDTKGEEGFSMMKSLEGTWEGKDAEGNPVRVSYKTVSKGSAVMETIDHMGEESVMVTMYHLDGKKLMMTHYCSVGNQPRMRLFESTPTSLSFRMFDATNIASNNDPHMHQLVITWKDKTHLVAAWTMRSKGKDSAPHAFTLERKS